MTSSAPRATAARTSAAVASRGSSCASPGYSTPPGRSCAACGSSRRSPSASSTSPATPSPREHPRALGGGGQLGLGLGDDHAPLAVVLEVVRELLGEPRPRLGRAQRQRQLALEFLVPRQHVALAGARSCPTRRRSDRSAGRARPRRRGGRRRPRRRCPHRPRPRQENDRSASAHTRAAALPRHHHNVQDRGGRLRGMSKTGRLSDIRSITHLRPSTFRHCGPTTAALILREQGDPGSTRGVCANGEAGAEGRRRSPLSPCRPHERSQRRPAARFAPVAQSRRAPSAAVDAAAATAPAPTPRATPAGAAPRAARSAPRRASAHRRAGRSTSSATAAGARRARPARGRAPRPRPARRAPRARRARSRTPRRAPRRRRAPSPAGDDGTAGRRRSRARRRSPARGERVDERRPRAGHGHDPARRRTRPAAPPRRPSRAARR